MTLDEEIAAAEKVLRDAGIDTARSDVEWIAARALGCRRGEMLADLRVQFPNGASETFAKMVARRAKREPLAYVLGTVVFRGLELEVGPGVLVPRPETEITAERAIARARECGPKPTVVDVGAGCGAIALAVAAEVPNARIFATEVSGAARGWALRNLARTGLRCTLLPGSLMQPLHPALGGGIDVVVSNPPYVAESEWDALQPEIRRYEPRDAIVGGRTGMELITQLAEQAATWLSHGGWLIVECADTHAQKVRGLFEYLGYADVCVTRDLAGRERVVEGRFISA